MNVLITGAPGFIGNHLCETLHEAGHRVSALSRDPASALRRVPALSRAFLWDSVVSPPPEKAFEQVHAMVHLAGEHIAGLWNAKKKRAVLNSRMLGTRHLVAGIKALDVRPKVLISASAIGYYGDGGEERLTERASPGVNFLAEVCRTWEGEAARARTLGLRVVHLRIGIVLGPGGGALKAMVPLFKLGLGGPSGVGSSMVVLDTS